MSKSDKREEILNAAISLFAEQGFHGAPMSQIAEKAGVAAGTIYRYFKSRDELIVDAHQMIHDKFMTYLAERYPEGRPVRECFFSLCKGVIEFHIKYPLLFKYSEQFFHSPYGMEMRLVKLMNPPEEGDLFSDIYTKGLELQVIKNIPKILFFNLAFAPIFWVVKDHHSGFINIDATISEIIVSACWDSIKI